LTSPHIYFSFSWISSAGTDQFGSTKVENCYSPDSTYNC